VRAPLGAELERKEWRMYLTRRTYLGLIGGALIMIAVFLTGTGVNFDTKALNVTQSLLLFITGLGVMVFARLGRRTMAAYSAIAATTLGLALVIDLLRNGALDLTVKLVVLVVGIVLALMASIGGDLMTYIAPTRDGAFAISTTGSGKSSGGNSSAAKSSAGTSSSAKSKSGATATK
jgi:hypothetical protein